MVTVQHNTTLRFAGSEVLATEPAPSIPFFGRTIKRNHKDGFLMKDWAIPQPSKQFMQSMNCFFTLNMDMDRMDYSNKPRFQFPTVKRVLREAEKQGLIEKVIVFYEYSATGKLHFHGILKFPMQKPKYCTDKPYHHYQTKFIDHTKMTALTNLFVKSFQHYTHAAYCIDFSLIKTKKSKDNIYNYCTKDNHNKDHCMYYTEHLDLKKLSKNVLL